MTDLYIPQGAVTLENAEQPQIRLGIQGFGGEGKTWSALTFPNPVVCNFDRGLGAHKGRADVIEVPFHNPAFVDKWAKRTSGGPPNRRDAFENWLEKEAVKLVKQQTLIIDGGTGVEDAFDAQENMEPVINSKGEQDKFSFWRHKIEYYGRIVNILKSLSCDIVWISHEQSDRDSKGELNGKLKPLLTGQFADKILTHFTDWVRCIAMDKQAEPKEKTLKDFGFKNAAEYKVMCDTFPRNTIYVWKLESDDVFSGKISSLVNFPTYIPANYSAFQKFMRK